MSDSVRAGVFADLEVLGFENSGEGRAALVLAARLDDPAEDETTSGAASAARELRMLMADIRARPSRAAADPLDELASQRGKRLAG